MKIRSVTISLTAAILCACGGGSSNNPVPVDTGSGNSSAGGNQQVALTALSSTPFPASDANYGCYRIPAIIRMPNGDILAFSEGRPAGCADYGNIQIVMKRSTDAGASWSEQVVVARNASKQAGNAVPLLDTKDPRFPGGRLFLFYNTGNAPESTIRNGGAGLREQYVISSTDNGQSWSTPRNITSQTAKIGAAPYNNAADWRTLAMGPGHGLMHSGGRLVIPGNFTAGPPLAAYADNRAYVFYSDDHGDSFKIGEPSAYPGANETTAAELSDGKVMLNSRDQSGASRRRIVAVSSDGGANFGTAMPDSTLPDPVCEGSLLNIVWQGKKYLAFSNPASTSGRNRLTIRISPDDGKSWPYSMLVTADASAYSDLTLVDPNTIGVIYENGSNGIRFMRVPLNSIIK
ncbi:sialidase family protein [Undibacterium squillarum]|nr:sialidase family protein [Undibacterium squillarum]